MLSLSTRDLDRKQDWQRLGVELPRFCVDSMIKKTKRAPAWIHFGIGNIFRGYLADLQQKLLNAGKMETGIIAVEAFDYEIIDRICEPYENLTLLVQMRSDGTMKKRIVASIGESIKCESHGFSQFQRCREIFLNPALQMVTFTITEKGYALSDLTGNYLPVIEEEFKTGPGHSKHVMSLITSLLFERYMAGELPVSLVSLDNCSQNGEKLKSSILTIALKWRKNGFVDEGFIEFLNNEDKISFPWTMIDKITPRPSPLVAQHLKELDISRMDAILTGKGTFIAPFVNTEVPEYLVIEDRFPNGRPPLEDAGVLFTDRDTVNKTERMKVTTCLNPLHTALAIFGCLLGYSSISEEMKDPQLQALTEKIGYVEGLPVVVNPKILSPEKFLREVIEERLPNPYIYDTPQRIATDTSQKIGIRFGETIKSYIKRSDLDIQSLLFIPLTIAGWLRYLLGIDDAGRPMEVSSDPMLNELTEALNGVVIGDPESSDNKLEPILSNSRLFGIDLYKAGLGGRIEEFFKQLIAGKNAVRNTLIRYIDFEKNI